MEEMNAKVMENEELEDITALSLIHISEPTRP